MCKLLFYIYGTYVLRSPHSLVTTSLIYPFYLHIYRLPEMDAQITMNKLEGARVAVVGGRNTSEQQYTGTVGGQSIDFSTLQSEFKTAHLESDPLYPPDFITNSFQGLTWRLGYDILSPPLDPLQGPEEWLDHKATESIPLTFDT